MLHDGDRAGENDIGVDETAELHGVELSAELQPEALPADHARHAEQRQRQEVERVVAAQNARGNGRYIIHGEVGLRVGEIALAAVRGGKVIDRHDRPADGKQSPADAREQAADDGDRRRNADGGLLFRQQQSGLSIADFCENEGYSRSRFYLWKQKYGITERELLAEASRLGVKDSFVPIVINGDTPSPGISHEAPLPSPQPSVPFPLKGKDSSEISLELPNGLKLKFKGSSGCEAALNLISKIYNANVLPK